MIISVKDLCKTYKQKDKEINVLKNVNFEFEVGKLYAIMGRSGVGKSTFFNLIGAIDNYFSGSIIIDDKDIAKMNDNELSELRNKKIGFVFQDYFLDNYLKAYENVILPMLANNDIEVSKREEKANELLREVDMQDRKAHFPKEMSGGECQRIAIARSLANDPTILLCDEPTGNLDLENATMIFKLLKSLSTKGKCVIIVSHDEEVKKYADVTLILKDGKLVKDDI